MKMSDTMIANASQNLLQNIDLMVCDMAGTVVNEGGLVYKILQKSIEDAGLKGDAAEFHGWHGAKKEAVIEHFARQNGVPEHEIYDKVLQIADVFTAAIDSAYFDEASTISHIDVSLFSYFSQLKSAGVKIALDTGYPP